MTIHGNWEAHEFLAVLERMTEDLRSVLGQPWEIYEEHKSGGMTIGFLGTGVMEVDAATLLLEEHINEVAQLEEQIRFIFPLTTKEFSDSLWDLARMAKAARVPYEVITVVGHDVHAEMLEGATRAYQVDDLWGQMEAILLQARQATLVVLGDDRQQEIERIVHWFLKAGITVIDMDMTNGMTERRE